jgi:hypothetical protein
VEDGVAVEAGLRKHQRIGPEANAGTTLGGLGDLPDRLDRDATNVLLEEFATIALDPDLEAL